jgi:hypothetical protein
MKLVRSTTFDDLIEIILDAIPSSIDGVDLEFGVGRMLGIPFLTNNHP